MKNEQSLPITNLKNIQSINDLFAKDGIIQNLVKSTVETILQGELEDHLGFSFREKPELSENCRNGHYKKSIKTSAGKVDLAIPRDREGSFEPKIIPKYEGINSKLEQSIISMYAKGMSTREISSHLEEMYSGMEISPTLISKITDKVLVLAKEWQSRPLDEVYPIIFFDAIHKSNIKSRPRREEQCGALIKSNKFEHNKSNSSQVIKFQN